MNDARLTKRDLALTLLVFAAAFALYQLTFQPLLFGDGPQLLQIWLHHEDKVWMHALYMQFVRLLGWFVPGEASITELQLASTVPAAAAVAGTFLLARTFAQPAFAGCFAAALLAFAPATWFFGTTVEVHALHAGCVVFAALVTVLAPWHRPVLALVLTATVFPLVYLSHKSGVLLGPGWLYLVAYGHKRRGIESPLRVLLLVTGPVLLASLLAGMLITNMIVTGTFGTGIGETTGFIERFQLGWSPSHMVSHWLYPSGGALILLAVLTLRWKRPLRPMLWLIFPGVIFFQWYGEQNHGGYLLGGLAFAALLAGSLPIVKHAPTAILLFAMVTAVQALSGYLDCRSGWDPETLKRLRDRAGFVEKHLGKQGVLVSADPDLQPVTALVPGIEEICLTPDLWGAVHAKLPTDAFLQTAPILIERVANRVEGAVAVDLSYQNGPAAEAFGPYVLALETLIKKRFRTTERVDGRHRLLLVER